MYGLSNTRACRLASPSACFFRAPYSQSCVKQEDVSSWMSESHSHADTVLFVFTLRIMHFVSPRGSHGRQSE